MKLKSIAIMLGLSFSIAASAQLADCGGRNEQECPVDHYLQAVGPSPDGSEEGEGEAIGACDLVDICRNNSLPPAPPTLTCTPLSYWHECEVWPQGPGFSYVWSATSPAMLTSVALDFPPSGSGTALTPYQAFTCMHTEAQGSVTVTVISPSGTRSQGTFSLNCIADLPLPTDPVITK